MPCRGIVGLGLTVSMFAWHFAPAWADTDRETQAYTRLTFIAEQVQDQFPRLTARQQLRPIVTVQTAKFRARIDMYFAPGEPAKPAFARARYNVRGANLRWRDVDTGFQGLTFRSSADFQAIMEGAILVSDLRGPVAPGVLDYSETPMPKAALVASAIQVKGGLADFLSTVELLYEDSADTQTSPLVLEMHLALPEREFNKRESEFKTQARLSFEYYDLANKPRSILYRKMHYGTAKTAPLNEAESAELSKLLSLYEHSCETQAGNVPDPTRH